MADQDKLEQDINDIKNAVNAISRNVKRIENALARDRYIPTTWHKIRYSHKDRQLIFDNRYRMQFKGNDADVLRGLFYRTGKKAGQPKPGEFLVAKIAKDNALLNLKPDTHKSAYQALKRINDHVLQATRLELLQLDYTTLRFNEFSDYT